MKGDPTEFGHEFCKMDPRGYEYIKESIRLPSSHSYCHSAGTTVNTYYYFRMPEKL